MIISPRDPKIIKKTLQKIGADCKEYRESIGLRLLDVAAETGYAIETVQGFEKGRTNNLILLLWYIRHGMQVK